MSEQPAKPKLPRKVAYHYFSYRDDLIGFDRDVLGGKFGVLNSALSDLREHLVCDVEGNPYETEGDAIVSLTSFFDYWWEIYYSLEKHYVPLVNSKYEFTEDDYAKIFEDGIFNNDTVAAFDHLRELGAILDTP